MDEIDFVLGFCDNIFIDLRALRNSYNIIAPALAGP